MAILKLSNSAMTAENSYSQYRNEWLWLGVNKTLLAQAGGGLDLACRLQHADPWLIGTLSPQNESQDVNYELVF